MHQFADGKIGYQKGHEKQMNVKEQADPLGEGGMKAEHPHGPLLHLHKVGLEKEPHEKTGNYHGQEQENREIIRGKGNVTNLRIGQSSQEEVDKGRHNNDSAIVDYRHDGLENPIQDLDEDDKGGDRFEDEA